MKRDGFALLATLWLLAMVGAATTIGLTAARLSVKAARNRVLLAKAEWARDGCFEILKARYESWAAQADAVDQTGLNRDPGRLFTVDSTDLGDSIWCNVQSTDGGSVVPRYYADSAGICPRMVPAPGFQWRLNLNTAPASLLGCLPGLDRAAVGALVENRRRGPAFRTMEEVLAALSIDSRTKVLASYGALGRMAALQPPLLLINANGWAGRPALSSRVTVVAAAGGAKLVVFWREAQ